jgi:outer membrane protein TolC
MRSLLLVPLFCAGLCAADPPASVSEGFIQALARAPAINAARARCLAAERARWAAGVLPDPMVGVDVGQARPRMGEDMTMYGAMVEQTLPRWGERDAMRQTAQAQESMALAEFAEVVGEHAAAVAAALAEVQAATETTALIGEARERVRALGEIVRSRVASGGAMIGDILSLDTRAQQLDLQMAESGRRGADAAAEVRGRLALAVDASLPPPAWPDPAAIRPQATTSVHRASAGRAEAEAMERAATARGNPETALGLIWEREAAGTVEELDTFRLSFKMSVPVWRGAYADAVDAAHGRVQAASHEARAAAGMARSQIGRAQRAAAQGARAQATAEAIAERSRTEYEAVIRQVGTGAASLPTALDLLDRITEARMQAIEARLTGEMALAELWRLAPPALPASEAAMATPHAGSATP